ncbi:MAG: HAMP domain-containing protein [Deltaproteobacteria bacterium]|nr:HAMP domain-containing protein [Deltaproteobacteria bacterium]
MNRNNRKRSPSFFTDEDRRRQKREGVMILGIIAAVAILTYVEHRVVHFGADIPVSNAILMFILINISLLLLVLLIFLVFRNLVKLLYDRRRKVMGFQLRTRLAMAFVMLTLLPTTVLFFFSMSFITISIKFWFDVNVEAALEHSLDIGQQVYAKIEDTNRFCLEKISVDIIDQELLGPDKQLALSHFIQNAVTANRLQAVEIYSDSFHRTALAVSPERSGLAPKAISADHFQKVASPRHFVTLFQSSTAGELVRSIATLPFGIDRMAADGFVVVTDMIAGNLENDLAVISRGVQGYRQMKMIKGPYQLTYYIALSIVALLVVFCAVWFGFYLAKTISIPIQELAEGTRRVAGGDLDVTIDLVAGDEIGLLVNSFNKMTQDLRESRDQLERSARMLRLQNVEIEERRQFMEVVLKHVSAGVITLDSNGCITTMSQSAEKMLNLQAEALLNKKYLDLLDGQQLQFAKDIQADLDRTKNGFIERPVRVTINERLRSFLLHINSLTDEAKNPLGSVIVFDDLTEIEKAQRIAAWREVARRIAHEVKNPLTPITLSAQRLKRKYAHQIDEPVFTECVQMIIDHVGLIRNLVNEFSAYAKFPSVNPKASALAPVILETVSLYREGHPSVVFNVQIPDDLPELSLDHQQMKQAMINLVDNAISAIKSDGSIEITVTHDPILKLIRIEVADNGPGISDEEKIRLFEPYFSTKQSGMGLGLTIVNSIVADHFGMIQVQDNYPRGAKFVIELPSYDVGVQS